MNKAQTHGSHGMKTKQLKVRLNSSPQTFRLYNIACRKEYAAFNVWIISLYISCFYSQERQVWKPYYINRDLLLRDCFILHSGARFKCNPIYTSQILRLSLHSVFIPKNFRTYTRYPRIYVDISVTALSKAWTIVTRLNAGIMGSNPLNACMSVCLFCVCVVLCIGSGLVTGSFPVQGVLPSV
jgi:hypothetical protein